MLEQPLVFTGCSSIQFFNLPSSPTAVSQGAWCNLPLTVQHLCDLWDAMPLHWSPSAFHPNSCLGQQRISLGVTSILSMFLCSHALFTTHKKVLLGRFYLCVRDYHGTLYQPLAGFEPTLQ